MLLARMRTFRQRNLKDVKSFFKQYYVPNNASLAIVGDINKTETLALVEKYFGSLKKGPDVPPVKVTTPPITEERRLVVKDRIELPRLYMAWIVRRSITDADAVADIGADILGGDKVSRLYRNLVYEKQIAQDVARVQHVLILWVRCSRSRLRQLPITLLKKSRRKLMPNSKRFVRRRRPNSELNGTKRSFERNALFSLESSGRWHSGSNQFVQPSSRRIRSFLEQDLQRYRKATPESIRTSLRSI